MTDKHYYAAHSYMGLGYTYDSPCWRVYVFDSKAERDAWVDENEYNNGNYVAEAVNYRTACKIAPDLRDKAHYDIHSYNRMPSRVTHL